MIYVHNELVAWQYDESRSQELLERKMMKAPAGQGTVRMLTREEWEKFREIRPRTPFESKLARPNARMRTGEPLHPVKHAHTHTICLIVFIDMCAAYLSRKKLLKVDFEGGNAYGYKCVQREMWF